MTTGPWKHAVKTKRGAPILSWSGIARDYAAVQAETTLMREIAWTAMLGPKAPPLPTILAQADYLPGSAHPGPAPGWIHDSLTWELGSGFSRQLEAIDYDTFQKPVDKATVARLCDALLRSDPYVAALFAAGIPVHAYLEDRSHKAPELRSSRHPYCARVRAELMLHGPQLLPGGKLAKARCHPVTLTALMAVALSHQNHHERDFFSYYYAQEVATPNSATLRATMGRGQEARTEAAYAILEERGFAGLVAGLRARAVA